MRVLIVILILLVAPLAVGQSLYCTRTDGEPPCIEHACSDDTVQVWGNEWALWFFSGAVFDPDGDGTPDEVTRIQIGLDTGGGFVELCENVTSCPWNPYRSPCFPPEGEERCFAVRACGPPGVGCEPWPRERVCFIGGIYLCLARAPDGTACEEPCYDAAPRRLPAMPACGGSP